jgi:Phage integrase family
MHPRYAAASSAHATPRVCARCDSMTLRHTYGSLLVAGGVDLASVKAAMGRSRITTTERYLHARSASEMADRFTHALTPASSAPEATPVASARPLLATSRREVA